jgi:hypothetical protein
MTSSTIALAAALLLGACNYAEEAPLPKTPPPAELQRLSVQIRVTGSQPAAAQAACREEVRSALEHAGFSVDAEGIPLDIEVVLVEDAMAEAPWAGSQTIEGPALREVPRAPRDVSFVAELNARIHAGGPTPRTVRAAAAQRGSVCGTAGERLAAEIIRLAPRAAPRPHNP